MKVKLPEAARRAGLHRHTLWVWVKNGLIPATKMGKKYVLDEETVELLVNEGTEYFQKLRRANFLQS